MAYYIRHSMTKDIYAALGVKRRINAAGTLTRLGGALMDEEVVAAMAAAARASVDIGELQAAASRTIARITARKPASSRPALPPRSRSPPRQA